MQRLLFIAIFFVHFPQAQVKPVTGKPPVKVVNVSAGGKPVTYTLAASARTSSGVYTTSGTLVRTLWSNIVKNAGSHTITWDGKLDDLATPAPPANYVVKVVSNNLKATWEGVIGNTSSAITGSTVHRQFNAFMDMCIVGNSAYVCADFAEREGSTYKIDLADPQKKIDILPHSTVQQTTNRLCSDGVRLYMGGSETQGGRKTYVAAATFANLYHYENYLPFQGESVKTFESTYKGCNILENAGRITGMAVQQSGNYLFVARKDNNTVHVLHKITGALAKTLTFSNPTLLTIDVDDNVWVARDNGTIVEKFTVNKSTGALTATGTIITRLTSVQGMDISGSTIAVADAGASHQVKGYSTKTGALNWTLGQNSSYSTNATIADDKFYFKDARSDASTFSFVAYQTDGSFWIGDKGNCRYQKFNSSRVYQTQIAFLPHCWSSYVDPNNPNRVFADYLEYAVDYSKPLQAGNADGAWRLVRNWGFNITANDDGDHDRLKYVTTLKNGRTYALSHNGPAYTNWEIIELVKDSTLRFTGVTIPRYEAYQLRPDGSIIGLKYQDDNVTWERKSLIGFDDFRNPVWNGFSGIANSSAVDRDSWPGGEVFRPAEITSTNMIISFKAGLGGGYHLAGMPIGGTAFKWKTAKTINSKYGNPFPADGTYEVGQNVKYAGSTALALDRLIVWGHRGEFWQNAQTNIWNVVFDNGLFLGQFGTTADQRVYPGPQAQAAMAGNAFSPSLVKAGGNYYLYHNDESYHGGLHRWKITGVNTIQEISIPVTEP